jgi:hypothetical protein
MFSGWCTLIANDIDRYIDLQLNELTSNLGARIIEFDRDADDAKIDWS